MSETTNPQFTRIERTEAALRLSEATKTAILDTALDCIVTIDHEGTVIDWNPAAERTFGYTAAEALGCEMSELIIPEAMQEMHRRGLARAVSSGNDLMAGKRIEITARRKNGVEIPVELAITRIAAHPNPLFTGHIRDISDRKRAEEELRNLNRTLEQRVKDRTEELTSANAALREGENRYRILAEHTPAAIVVMDTDAGKFIEANENAVKLFGLSRKELLEVGPIELSPALQPDGQVSAKAARAKIKKALRGDTPVFEWTHRNATGCEIPCEVRVARMPATKRNLIIGAITDITARKKAEAELRSALEQEKELSQLKTNFVNIVSHEFRTPLGVIVSSAEILENYLERLKPEQRAGHLQDIRYATQQMTSLMEEVLLLGKVEAGKMEFKPEPLDLGEFCRRLADEQLSVTNRKCPIMVEFHALEKQSARGDEALLRHIFTNLLSNAVKYSLPGSEVHFTVTRDEAEAVFEVRDHGIGIPPEDQKRLFEAFHRARNVGDIPGTGLGLVIVKRCVDLHNGTIKFESQPHRGTRFEVRLKLFEPVSQVGMASQKKGARKR